MKNLEQTEKSPSLSYQNPPGAWQRGERASKQHLLSFSEKKLLSEMFPKKNTCWGMEEKSLCLLGGGTSEPKGNSFAGTHHQGHLSLGFVTATLPVGLTPSAKLLLPPPACRTPTPPPANVFCTRAHPNNSKAIAQITLRTKQFRLSLMSL